jgi:hypothetical protein
MVEACGARGWPRIKRNESSRQVVSGREERYVDVSSDAMEHASQCNFGAIIRVRKVLWCWEDDGSMEESGRAEESGQTQEGAVNPLLLLCRNRKLRLGESKHATVIAERPTDPRKFSIYLLTYLTNVL